MFIGAFTWAIPPPPPPLSLSKLLQISQQLFYSFTVLGHWDFGVILRNLSTIKRTGKNIFVLNEDEACI